MTGTPFEGAIKDGIDPTSVEGAADMPYGIPNQLVDYHPVDNGVPVLWWRSVGHSYTAFIVESFLDDVDNVNGPFMIERFARGENGPKRDHLSDSPLTGDVYLTLGLVPFS